MNVFDLWETQPDRNREKDWTCRARGATMGRNIIDRVVVSHAGFSDGEIHTALKDFIPGTDHRAVFAFVNIEPSNCLANQHLVFMTHEATHLKPRIRYLAKTEKHKFNQFRTAVDKMAHEQNLAEQSVIGSESFVTCYKLLTNIFDKCTSDVFSHVKPYRGNTGRPVTSVQIQHILSQIRSVRGAIRLANNPEGDVSINSILLYNKSFREFQTNPNGLETVRGYLVQLCKRLYKDLYRERMEAVTARAKETDKKRIAGALLGGSTRKLVIAEEYQQLLTYWMGKVR
jgi:predicted secreted protein